MTNQNQFDVTETQKETLFNSIEGGVSYLEIDAEYRLMLTTNRNYKGGGLTGGGGIYLQHNKSARTGGCFQKEIKVLGDYDANMSFEIVRDLITEKLLSDGGAKLCTIGTSAIVVKGYNTQVGVKDAIFYFYNDGDCLILQGEYMSQGRNVLEPYTAYLYKPVNFYQLEFTVSKFIKDVTLAIQQSYAYRVKHGTPNI